MGYDNTKTKGDAAELEVMVLLKRQGFSVSVPFGENTPYDLIAESPGGELFRVQVRWVTWKKDVLEVSLRMVSKNYSKTLDRSRIDTFVAWDGEKAFVIPVADTESCNAYFSIRRTKPRNGQVEGIRMASQYEGAFHNMGV